MWELVAGTARKKIPQKPVCQDRAAGVACGALHVLCVSDGLGSCSLSHVGAGYAVRHFTAAAPRMYACASDQEREKMFCDSLRHFRERMQQVARKKECAVDALASTLVLLLVSREGVWGFRVGDGFAVVRFGEQFVSLFPSGEGARDITETLLGARAQYDVCCELQPAAFAMCSSDGLYNLTYDVGSSEPHQVFFREFEGGLAQSHDAHQYLRRVLRASLERDPTDDKGVAVLFQKYSVS